MSFLIFWVASAVFGLVFAIYSSFSAGKTKDPSDEIFDRWSS